jgi:hypothetical protein
MPVTTFPLPPLLLSSALDLPRTNTMSDVDLLGWLAKAEASQARHAAAVAQEASLRAQVSAAAEWERSGRRALHLATALHAGTAAELLESSSRLQHATARLAQLALIQPPPLPPPLPAPRAPGGEPPAWRPRAAAALAGLQAEAQEARREARARRARCEALVLSAQATRKQLALLVGRLNELAARVEATRRARDEALRSAEATEGIKRELQQLGHEVLTEAEVAAFFET